MALTAQLPGMAWERWSDTNSTNMSVVSTLEYDYSSASTADRENHHKTWNFLLENRVLTLIEIEQTIGGLRTLGGALRSEDSLAASILETLIEALRRSSQHGILLKSAVREPLHSLLCPLRPETSTTMSLRKVNRKKRLDPRSTHECSYPAASRDLISSCLLRDSCTGLGPCPRYGAVGLQVTVFVLLGSDFLDTQAQRLRRFLSESIPEFWYHRSRQYVGVHEMDISTGRPDLDTLLEEESRSRNCHLYVTYTWRQYLPRYCFIIASVMFGFIALSLVLGIVFTTSTEHSMGDSFTLAGYVIAVGGLVCSFLLACHYPSCDCWKTKSRALRELAGEEGR